jgi:hypothetical protein
MKQQTVEDHVRSMRASLQMIDLQLDRSKLTRAGIADLKSEVDSVRLRIWSIMASEMANEGPGGLDRFRVRRAIEITNKICDDLERGIMGAEHPELGHLEALSLRFVALVKAAKSTG